MMSATSPSRKANGTAYAASSSPIRLDRAATSIAAGSVRSARSPRKSATRARALLLDVGPATRCRRDRPADHAGDGDQGQDVRKCLEEDCRVPPRIGEAARERGRAAEQQRGSERAEGPQVSED